MKKMSANQSSGNSIKRFRANFLDGWERGGAAFVVYHNGKKVVDLWGGHADKESKRLWKKDTLNVAFSSTKVTFSRRHNLLMRYVVYRTGLTFV